MEPRRSQTVVCIGIHKGRVGFVAVDNANAIGFFVQQKCIALKQYAREYNSEASANAHVYVCTTMCETGK